MTLPTRPSLYVFPSPHHAATAPRSAVAELGVVRRFYAHSMKAAFIAVLFSCTVAFGDQTEWTLGSVTLRAAPTGTSRPLTTHDGTKLHEFAERDDVRGSIVSKAGSCLLLLVSISRPTKPGSAIRGAWDYGYLLRITKTSDGRLTAKKVMDRATPFMTQRQRGVSELGAVSDDGSSALIKFSEADADEAPYRMSYAWQTWELDTPKKLADGLTLDNAKKP